MAFPTDPARRCAMKIAAWSVLGAAAVALASAQLAAADGPYVIRDDYPAAGSNINRALVSSDVSFDKRYSELAPDELARVRSKYPKLAAGDEPPYPKDGLTPVIRQMVHRQDRPDPGRVDVGVRVDRDGRAQTVAVYATPNPDTAKVVAYALMGADYKPAICAGQACPGEYRFDFEFR
jgi:hypothetical protein